MPDVPARGKIERAITRGLGQVWADHAEAIKRGAGDPPQIGRVPESVWRRHEQETEEEIAAGIMLLIALMGARVDGDALAQGLLNRSHVAGGLVAKSTKSLIADRFTRARTAGELDGDRARIEIDAALSSARAEGIAATEATSAGSLANRAVADERQERTGRPNKLIWRLDDNCRHCRLCPMLSGTSEQCWQRIIEAPPAHMRCCCYLDIAGAEERERECPPIGSLLSVAREVGVFGF